MLVKVKKYPASVTDLCFVCDNHISVITVCVSADVARRI